MGPALLVLANNEFSKLVAQLSIISAQTPELVYTTSNQPNSTGRESSNGICRHETSYSWRMFAMQDLPSDQGEAG